MRTVPLAILLALWAFTPAGAQSLTATGTFTPLTPFDATTPLWVAVDTVQGAGRVSVDVRDNAGTVLGAPLNFEIETPGPRAQAARPVRPLKEATPLRLEIAVKPYGTAAPVVRGASLAGSQQVALALVSISIDPIQCTGSTCPVCYTLGQSAEVRLDTFPDVGGKAVRTAFHTGREGAGAKRSEWDRIGDDRMPRSSGRYYVKLHAENANREGADILSRFFSLPPGAPGACR